MKDEKSYKNEPRYLDANSDGSFLNAKTDRRSKIYVKAK